MLSALNNENMNSSSHCYSGLEHKQDEDAKYSCINLQIMNQIVILIFILAILFLLPGSQSISRLITAADSLTLSLLSSTLAHQKI